jgi:hypothetical protein
VQNNVEWKPAAERDELPDYRSAKDQFCCQVGGHLRMGGSKNRADIAEGVLKTAQTDPAECFRRIEMVA